MAASAAANITIKMLMAAIRAISDQVTPQPNTARASTQRLASSMGIIGRVLRINQVSRPNMSPAAGILRRITICPFFDPRRHTQKPLLIAITAGIKATVALVIGTI